MLVYYTVSVYDPLVLAEINTRFRKCKAFCKKKFENFLHKASSDLTCTPFSPHVYSILTSEAASESVPKTMKLRTQLKSPSTQGSFPEPLDLREQMTSLKALLTVQKLCALALQLTSEEPESLEKQGSLYPIFFSLFIMKSWKILPE